jgi:hypothetical protein
MPPDPELRPALYVDHWTVDPGDRVRVMASGAGPATATLVCLRGLIGEPLPTGYREDLIGRPVPLELVERSVPAGSLATTPAGPIVAQGVAWAWALKLFPTLVDCGGVLSWGYDGPRLLVQDVHLKAEWGGASITVPIDSRAWSNIVLRFAPGDGMTLASTPIDPGGGAMGDSTFILQGLIERGIGGIALGGIWDPGAVQLCFDAGVGAKFLMRIGGKTGPASGLPTDVTAQVMALVPDHSQDDFGARANLGPSAWVRTEQGIDVALISVRQQVLGLDLFTGLGIELNGRRGIVVKSMQHFLSAFDLVVGGVLLVDTPGLLSTDFANIPFKNRSPVFWPRSENAH